MDESIHFLDQQAFYIDFDATSNLAPAWMLEEQAKKGVSTALANNIEVLSVLRPHGSLFPLLKEFLSSEHGLSNAINFFTGLVATEVFEAREAAPHPAFHHNEMTEAFVRSIIEKDIWLARICDIVRQRDPYFVEAGTTTLSPYSSKHQLLPENPLHHQRYMNHRDFLSAQYINDNFSQAARWLFQDVDTQIAHRNRASRLSVSGLIDDNRTRDALCLFISSLRYGLALQSIGGIGNQSIFERRSSPVVGVGLYNEYLQHVVLNFTRSYEAFLAPVHTFAGMTDRDEMPRMNAPMFLGVHFLRNGEHVSKTPSLEPLCDISPYEVLFDVPGPLVTQAIRSMDIIARLVEEQPIVRPLSPAIFVAGKSLHTRLHHTIAQACAHIIENPSVTELPESLCDMEGHFMKTTQRTGSKHLFEAQKAEMGHPTPNRDRFPLSMRERIAPTDQLYNRLRHFRGSEFRSL
jgi:hypothetical protein